VGVHVGARSDDLNTRLQAKAFTLGSDVYIHRSFYAPGTKVGQRLLAHELAHTVQQRPDRVRRSPLVPLPSIGATGIGRIQRDFDSTEGLIELAPGVLGEVGLPAMLKRGAVLTLTGGGSYTAPADIKCLAHQIQDKKNYFVRLPAKLKGFADSADEATRAKASTEKMEAKLGPEDRNSVTGLVKRGSVKATETKLAHKTVKNTIFPHPPVPEDIEQLGLANCYFLAALSSIVRREPAFIKDMLKERPGLVSARFYRIIRSEGGAIQRTKTEYVTVKKSIAISSGGGDAFTGTDQALWPAMATKAYAAWPGHSRGAMKGYGGTYTGTEYGDAHEAMMNITGDMGQKDDIVKKPKDRSGDITFNKLDITNWLLPGDPRRPPVMPWNADLAFGKKVMVDKKKLLSTKPDPEGVETPKQLGEALARNLLGPVGLSTDDVTLTINEHGTMTLVVPGVQMVRGAFKLDLADATKWSAFLNTNKAEINKLGRIGTSDTAAMDKPTFEKLLNQSGISSGAMDLLRAAGKDYITGTAKDPYYNKHQLLMYTKISTHLADGGFVAAGTPDYGAGGGHSGNEDIKTVPGVAGGHAYSVVNVRIEEGRRFIELRNPWGNTGAEYSEDFSERRETTEGQFELELSDFTNLFTNVYYQARPPQGEAPSQYDVAKRLNK
jgi:hypothetical protein